MNLIPDLRNPLLLSALLPLRFLSLLSSEPVPGPWVVFIPEIDAVTLVEARGYLVTEESDGPQEDGGIEGEDDDRVDPIATVRDGVAAVEGGQLAEVVVDVGFGLVGG